MDPAIRFLHSFDGTRIAFRTQGEGLPLLWLIEAFGSHTQLYGEQPGVAEYLARLSRHRTLIRIDCRGTGMSDRHCADSSNDAVVRDIEAVLNVLGVDRCEVFAAAARHAPVLRMAVDRPALFSRMIFSGAFAVPPDPAFGRLMEENWALFREIALQRSTHRPMHEIRDILAFTERCVDQRDFLAARDGRDPAESWALPAKIDVPVLVTQTKDCGISSPELNRKFAEAFPRGRYIELTAGTMPPPWGDPEALLQAVEEFLCIGGSEGMETSPGLTPRESQVLSLLAAGRTQAEVADELVISPATVSRHVVSVYAKLGVHRRAEAVAWAVRHEMALN